MKFFRLRKRYITLLETLVALTLLSVLLTLIFGFFWELSRVNQLNEENQKMIFHKRYLENRLAFLFERIVNDNDDKRIFYFFTQTGDGTFSDSPSLVMTFNNEARMNPVYAGDILSRLYVDKHHRLCLAIWPIFSTDPHEAMQHEILLEGVKTMHFELYAPPEHLTSKKGVASTKKIDPEKTQPDPDKWHPEWLKSYDQMPSLLKLHLVLIEGEQKGEVKKTGTEEAPKWDFIFVLPSSKNCIYYPPSE